MSEPSYINMDQRCVLLALLALTGCKGPIPNTSAAPRPADRTGVVQTMTVPGLEHIVALRTRPDGTPSLTISTPAHWVSRWEAGEDTRRHYFNGDGVSMTVETWTTEPTWACRSPSCGLSTILVDGVRAQLLRLSSPTRSVHAFIPRRGDASHGISVRATCSTSESCRSIEQAITSIRGF